MWYEKLARPEIVSLKAYSSARSENQNMDLILLDANESFEPPYGDNKHFLNRYPEPQPEKLRRRLADIYGVDSSQVLLTRGMDEGIDIVIRSFCRPYQDSIGILPPTYSYYKVAADINGVATLDLTETQEGKVKLEKLEDPLCCKILFFCSPNNPTGSVMQLEEIKKICETVAQRSLVVIDEAYIEFADGPSASCLLKECPNLIVMRTLSKAYGLAGCRIGAVLADQGIIQLLRKVLPPYPISSPSAASALSALTSIGLFDVSRRIESIKIQREWLSKKLKQSPKIKQVYPSQGNFILFTCDDSQEIYRSLKSRGIVVRDRSGDVPNSLRVSVGSVLENQLLIRALGGPCELLEPKNRGAKKSRKTQETEILCEVSLDSQGNSEISTGLPFFDHMLEQLAVHGGFSLTVRAVGDVLVDSHHTVEDVAIVLGETLRESLGSKLGIRRYGFVLPMDESQSTISLDLGGRGAFVFECKFPGERIGDFPVEMISHFFSTLSAGLGAAIHIQTKGENAHHMAESIFKGFGRSLRQAVELIRQESLVLPSTKGVL
jgi:histidinol-phosphate aminotransferase